ncbi:MFS transporter [Pokkaliibacter sp. MBI-7]|uniref:MFS transporter n=1 Tax=Pokkaliibacter sp. MBI-7 TaxID=3040600 RepID=UPI00244A31F1|nr:MFS transporter [Pokkaliibacter sp. MBI-7]MDH2435298.1 MFS transporter [Pokkaliibacter sp. MBI-7]
MKAIPSLWPQRAAVACMFSVNGILLASWVPHIPLVQVRLGLDHAALGLALLGLALGAMVSMPVSGWLIGKVGHREVSWFSAVLSCFSAALPAMAPDFFTLLLALIIYGACQGAMDVAMNAQAVRVEKDWGQPIMSSFHGMYSAGGLLGAGLLGAGLGGLYLHYFTPGWHMWLVAAVMLLAVVMTGRWLPEDGPLSVSSEEHKPRRMLTPALLALGVVAFIVMMTEGAMADWSAVFLSTLHSADQGTAALGFAAFSLCMAIGRFSGDYLVRRGSRRACWWYRRCWLPSGWHWWC